LLLTTLISTKTFAAPNPHIRIELRSGKSIEAELKGWNKKECKLQFSPDPGGNGLWVGDLRCLRFDATDTASVAALSAGDEDQVLYRSGRLVNGIIREIKANRVVMGTPGSTSTSEHSTAELQRVVFGGKILDVDRREFGTGFTLYTQDDEIQTGASFAKAIRSEEPLLTDSEVNSYLNDLGGRIAQASKRPDLPYRFFVIDGKEMNAFTPGGGNVYVYRGLLEQLGSESELAGVLAHEIGHNVGRHAVRSLTKDALVDILVESSASLLAHGQRAKGSTEEITSTVGGLIKSKFSRDDEREADFLATYNLYTMGYDPNGMISVFETLKKAETETPDLVQSFFDTHPPLDERVSNVSTELRKVVKANLKEDDPAFEQMKKRLVGLPWSFRHQLLANDTLQVPAMQVAAYAIRLPDSTAKDFTMSGRIRAYGGSGNDIRVVLLNEVDYLNWINGHGGALLYDSGKITVSEPKVDFASAGPYYLVLDNRFSTFTPKTVTLKLDLQYHER
jgi:hypothetical protein